jgi:peroxiredoxin
LQRIIPEIHAFNAELVAISPELPDNSLSLAEKNNLTFQLLSDQDNNYARQCGLVYTLDEELRPLYKSWGIDLPAANGNSTFELPLPATYVVAYDSHIALSFVNSDYTRRLEPSEILETLEDVTT